MTIAEKMSLKREVKRFLKYGFSPHYDHLRKAEFQSRPLWRRFRELGTELWLDTGNIPDAEGLWTQEFSGLTTNNTLLSREILSGRYDSVIAEMADLLSDHHELSEDERKLEFAFMLNAWHGLRLVERFEGYVSIEEHTCLADDVEAMVDYGQRLFAICPERFIIKVPFTPAGLLAARKLCERGVGVNQTLGFSPRQNYVSMRIAKPAFVNVFLGRLNSFVSMNNLGSGCYVGEKATLASQAVVRQIRAEYTIPTRQIAASIREGRQAGDLAGVDVLTMPPRAAADFLYFNTGPESVSDQTREEYIPCIKEDVDIGRVRLDTLWELDDKVIRCMNMLEHEDIDSFSADDLVEFFASHNCGDLLVAWSDEDRAVSSVEGKIPKLSNWHEKLMCHAIGLDSLMTLAGLMSFAADQKAIDDRVKDVLSGRHAG